MRFFRAKIAFLTFCFLLAGGAAFVRAVQAQSRSSVEEDSQQIPITTQIIIPGSAVEQAATGAIVGRVQDLAVYLGIVYNFLISIVGVVAAVMMMIGGFQYLTARGDAGAVKVARERIGNALIGLVLALSSYAILNTVNPNLVKLKVPQLAKVTTELNFMPFCDELESQYGKKSIAWPTVGARWYTRSCGTVGFVIKSDGSRVWCTYKGRITGVADPDNKDKSAPNDCGVESIANKDGKFLPVLSVCMPYNNAKSSAQLDAEFTEALKNLLQSASKIEELSKILGKVTKIVRNPHPDYDNPIHGTEAVPLTVEETRSLVESIVNDNQKLENFEENYGYLENGQWKETGELALAKVMEFNPMEAADCTSCVWLTSGRAQRMGYVPGDETCRIWQNMANNGRPDDHSFRISQKKHADKVNKRFWDDNNPNRLYYCGFYPEQGRCVYAPLRCNTGATVNIPWRGDPNFKVVENSDKHQKIENCGGYNETALMYCDNTDSSGNITCRAHNELGQSLTQAGYPIHLSNVCGPDPCETKGTGGKCDAPLEFIGSTARQVVTGATLGLANTYAKCAN